MTKVKVINDKRRDRFVLRWKDPETRKWRQMTTAFAARKKNRREVERLARDLELELGEPAEPSEVCWHEFNIAYQREHLAGLSKNSSIAWGCSVSHVEKHIKPTSVNDITTRAVSRLVAGMRSDDLAEASIASYLGQLRAGLQWAHENGFLDEMPLIRKPRRARGKSKAARARAVIGEEFDRMLMAAELVRPKDFGKIRHFITGLFLSGLRLREACKLSWDSDAELSISLGGDFPAMRIEAEGEKGHKDRLLPLTPEFAAFLEKTPPGDRVGLVFKTGLAASTMGRIVREVGKRAGIQVNKDGKTASAHDLRRSFATRLAEHPDISIFELTELMRHKSVDTTRQYYLHLDAQRISEKLQKGGALGGASTSTEESQIANERRKANA